MAEKHYLFVNNADFKNAVNWSLTRKGTGGATPPVSGDTVFVEAEATQNITGGIDGLEAIDLGGLTISGPVNIDDGSGLTYAVAGTVDIKNLTGTVRLKAGTGGYDLLHVRKTAGNGEALLVGGTANVVRVGRGSKCTIGGSATVPELETLGNTTVAAGSAGTTATADAGTLTSERSFGTWNIGPQTTATKVGAAAASTRITNYGTLIDHSYGTIADYVGKTGSHATAKDSPYPLTVTAAKRQDGAMVFDDSPGVTLPTTITPVGNTAT